LITPQPAATVLGGGGQEASVHQKKEPSMQKDLISDKQSAALNSPGRKSSRTLYILSVGLLMLSPVCFAATQQTPPDNTKTNQQDRTQGSTTADQQSESPADRELTRKVRKALMDDKDLSTYAHNIKIITKDGVVRLKGPVRSDEEKATIEAKATAIAGPSNVKDELTVKPQ
jgi:hyperosmotically inducible periplasmic protein